LKRHEADALRLWVLGTHYAQSLEFAEERLQEAGRALERLRGPSSGRAIPRRARPRSVLELAAFQTGFVDAMDDDFNTPRGRRACCSS
jgi:cysteinyl-tRNA synthetase